MNIQQEVKDLELLLENANQAKDRMLFAFLKENWPMSITPNHLTIVRVVIGVILFFLLFNYKNDSGLIIMPLFLLGTLTDLLDGVIARGFNKITHFGEIADPIADRILIMPIALYSLISYNRVLFLLIIFSEVINAIIAVSVLGKKIDFGSNIFGKTKMVLQSMVFIAILLFWPQMPNAFFVGLLWLSLIFMAISIIFKLISVKGYYEARSAKSLQYTFRQKRIIKTLKKQKA